MLVFERKPLERLTFVCQTGGNNAKVKWDCKGLESFVFGAILFGKLSLSKKGVINVFGEDDNKWLGFVKMDNDGLPRKYKADKELYFKDFYSEG